MAKRSGRRVGAVVLGSLGAGALSLSVACPASAALTHEGREDRVTFEFDGRDVTCRIFSSFEWNPDTDDLGVATHVLPVAAEDHAVCDHSFRTSR